jgi:2-polyprenyl-3-methyl-5-hydroxy-6-metoxy-1,4-benzoquinol methylase
MESQSRFIVNCRLCKKNKLDVIFDFGLIPLGNNLQSSIKDSLSIDDFPLVLVQCSNCKHFQLNFSVDPKILYATNYTYLSGIGNSFRKHLKEFCKSVLNYYCQNSLNQKIKVIDIGSNDGTALIFFQNQGCEVLGVDPAKKPSRIANERGIKTLNNFFSSDLAEEIKKKYSCFDIVISHNVLAHVDDVSDIFDGINIILKENGIFVFEIGYFGDIIQKNIFDTIYHEHLDYHSIIALSSFLSKKKFIIDKIELNSVQGGSLRVWCKKSEHILKKNKLLEYIKKEEKILSKKSIKIWRNKIVKNIETLKQKLKDYKSKNYIIVGYGVPTKATLVLKMLGDCKNNIDYFVEDNQLKVNKFLPSTKIPIKENFDENNNKKLILCFAWNFFDDIQVKLKNNGVKGILYNIQTGKEILI